MRTIQESFDSMSDETFLKFLEFLYEEQHDLTEEDHVAIEALPDDLIDQCRQEVDRRRRENE